ncbi:MAG: hypothetical protein ACLS61_06030 [Ruminococcus sp.]
MSGNESVHASPDTEVSCANSFSEEVGNASGNVSDVPKMETPTYSDSGISGNIESEQQVTNMGESSAQSAESGDLGNYSTTGDFAIDGLNGINEHEESYDSGNQTNTWNRIIWIQSKRQMTALHFQRK